MRTFAQKHKPTPRTKSASFPKPGRSHLGQSSEVWSILNLQHTLGNPAMQRLLQANAEELETGAATTVSTRFAHNFSRIPLHPRAHHEIQPKLMVSTSGDKYEQEADRTADHVMRRPEPQPYPAGACGGGCPRCGSTPNDHGENEQVWTSPPSSQPSHLPGEFLSLKGAGKPLPRSTVGFFGSRFGHDFSQVRVHTDRAAQSANNINSLAYTSGNDVVFGSGQYAPGTPEGQRLLAHELTHIVQQSRGDIQSSIPIQRQEKGKEEPWSISPDPEEGVAQEFTPGLPSELETAIRRAVLATITASPANEITGVPGPAPPQGTLTLEQAMEQGILRQAIMTMRRDISYIFNLYWPSIVTGKMPPMKLIDPVAATGEKLGIWDSLDEARAELIKAMKELPAKGVKAAVEALLRAGLEALAGPASSKAGPHGPETVAFEDFPMSPISIDLDITPMPDVPSYVPNLRIEKSATKLSFQPDERVSAKFKAPAPGGWQIQVVSSESGALVFKETIPDPEKGGKEGVIGFPAPVTPGFYKVNLVNFEGEVRQSTGFRVLSSKDSSDLLKPTPPSQIRDLPTPSSPSGTAIA